MQLVIDIDDNSLADKIIKILDVFKNDGLRITKKKMHNNDKNRVYTDEYLEKNWKEMVMTSGDSADYYKSEAYYEDRGKYLSEKYK